MTFSTPPTFTATFSGGENLKAEFGATVEIPIAEFYPGPYEITPTQEKQIIPIGELAAAKDITVNAIPNNYGLITWNGSTLTVS